MNETEKELLEAEQRLLKNLDKIKSRREQTQEVEEPEHIRSGILDEVELERRKKDDTE